MVNIVPALAWLMAGRWMWIRCYAMTLDAKVRFFTVCATVLAVSCSADAAQAESIDAASAKASFKGGRASGVMPQTPGEYLLCAAKWDRWEYFMLSSNIPAFNRDIGKDLSARAAHKQSAKLRQQARALANRSDHGYEFPALVGQAETDADAHYAAFINNEPGADRDFLMSLGICK